MNQHNTFYEKLKNLIDEELERRLRGEKDKEIVFSARMNLTMDVDTYIHSMDE